MANSISVDIGFKSVKGDISQVLGSVKELNLGVKDVVLGMKGLNSEAKELNKNVSENTFSKKLFKLRAYSDSLKDVFVSFKSLYSGISGLFSKSFGFADSYAEKGDKIAKTSRLVGLSVRDYQAFSSAAKDSGMSIEEMDSALKKFSVNIAKARGGDKKSLEMFGSLLPKGKKLSDYKDSATLLIAIADGYAKLSSSELKAFASSEIFGKSGLKMSEILSQGGESLRDFLNSYNKGFSDEGAKRAEAFTHELQMMLEEFEEIKISVAQELFPAFKELFGEISSMLRGEKGSELKRVLKDAGLAFKKFVLDMLPKIPTILENIVRIVGFLTPEVVVAGGTILSMLPNILSILFAMAALKPLITAVFGFVKKIGAVLFGLPSLVWDLVTGFKVAAVIVGGAFYAAVGGVLVLLGEMASIVYQFYKNWDMWCSFVNHELTDAVVEWWNQLKAVVSWAAESVGNIFRGIGEGVRDFVMGGLDTIYGAVQKIKSLIGGIFGGLPDRLQNFFGIGKAIESANGPGTVQTLGASAAQAVSESRTTVTNRFAVDFKNMPRGVQVTPPEQGDFDWSRGYLLGGV